METGQRDKLGSATFLHGIPSVLIEINARVKMHIKEEAWVE